MSPSAWWILATIPSNRLFISTVALSLCTSHNRSNDLILSPSYKAQLLWNVAILQSIIVNTFTNHFINSTSAIPSPISANLNGTIVLKSRDEHSWCWFKPLLWRDLIVWDSSLVFRFKNMEFLAFICKISMQVNQ